MEKKDLSLAYALKEYTRVNGESDPIFEDNRCFTFDDIKDAFNAGRESVVENMPDLKWQNIGEYNLVDTPFGRYYIDPHDAYLLLFNGVKIPISIGNILEQTKQVANEDYKERVKQALGL